ncbi:MAG: sialidase family protein [Clostridia bacterium]
MAIQKFTVSRDDSIYEAFPDLVLTASGKLVCVFAECTHHGDRSFTRIVTRHSNDRGRTWGEKMPVTEATKGFPYYNCPRISKLDDGRLVMACDRGYNPTNTGGRNFLWFSPDEGMSWEGPVEAPLSGIVPDKLLELSTGRWILAMKIFFKIFPGRLHNTFVGFCQAPSFVKHGTKFN